MRRQVRRRGVVLVGVEGKSDRAFVRFLGRLCDEARLRIHLDVKPSNGGDSLTVVEETVSRLRRHPDPRGISKRIVVLDRDRMREDSEAGRDALASAARSGLQVVLFDPNLEGLLVRLHEGREASGVRANDALRQLRRLWPEYSKSSLNADKLRRRFSLGDLERAAKHDQQLHGLLSVLGLIRHRS